MDTIGTTKTVLYMEVSLIQRLNNTVKYYCGMRPSVLNREMSFIQGVLYTCVCIKIYQKLAVDTHSLKQIHWPHQPMIKYICK